MSSAARSVAPLESQQEAAAVLAAAGAAQSARQAKISADIARYKAKIVELARKYAGRSGRYRSSDSRTLATAEEALKYLYTASRCRKGVITLPLSAGGSPPSARPPTPL